TKAFRLQVQTSRYSTLQRSGTPYDRHLTSLRDLPVPVVRRTDLYTVLPGDNILNQIVGRERMVKRLFNNVKQPPQINLHRKMLAFQIPQILNPNSSLNTHFDNSSISFNLSVTSWASCRYMKTTSAIASRKSPTVSSSPSGRGFESASRSSKRPLSHRSTV